MESREIVMQLSATQELDGNMIPERKIDELLRIIRFAPSALTCRRRKTQFIKADISNADQVEQLI